MGNNNRYIMLMNFLSLYIHAEVAISYSTLHHQSPLKCTITIVLRGGPRLVPAGPWPTLIICIWNSHIWCDCTTLEYKWFFIFWAKFCIIISWWLIMLLNIQFDPSRIQMLALPILEYEATNVTNQWSTPLSHFPKNS